VILLDKMVRKVVRRAGWTALAVTKGKQRWTTRLYFDKLVLMVVRWGG
jgi:hypothetical protein